MYGRAGREANGAASLTAVFRAVAARNR